LIARLSQESPVVSRLLAAPLLLGLTGCASLKGTYVVVTSQQQLHLSQQASAEEAEYYWTMADEHMRKAREEWGHSDYGAAEELAYAAADWARKAEEAAAQGVRKRSLEGATDIVPEDLDTVPEDPNKKRLIEPERIDTDFEEEEQ
jgi:hypothetical protein